MPTEDYSASLRTARTRQRKSLDGLGKVARAINISTQRDITLGGLYEKIKRPGFTTVAPVRCIGSFNAMTGVVAQGIYICDGTNCIYNLASYPQINAIPGTSITATGAVVIVNCTSNVVYLSINGSSNSPLEAQRAFLTNNRNAVYSFT